MTAFPPVDEQMKILMSGTEYGDATTRQSMERELRARLAEQRPLRVYLGVDPTAPDIHLGHSVPLRKLRQFQELGHHVIFLIGSFTARIGDPSDKDRTRPQLDQAAIEANLHTYTTQAFRLLDRDRTEIEFNARWLGEMGFEEVIRLASNFTVQQYLQRENFARRFAEGSPIFLHELFYPLMQGQDAVALRADVQLGGTDQTFNLMAGRTLQERAGQKPQVVMTTPMLPGTDGTQKMSKSLGNAIAIESAPDDMYGKLMSIPDEAMAIYARLLTPWHPDEQEAWLAQLASGALHPRDAKMQLARTITAVFHGEAGAAAGEQHFVRVFQKQALPDEMPERRLSEPLRLATLIHEAGFARGTGEARRLAQQGGVSLDGVKLTDGDAMIEPSEQPRVLKVGKRHFLRLL